MQAELTASAEAAGTPTGALGTCSALRAALVEHATALQKWAVAMQLEGVRQGSAVRRLVEREARLAELHEAEAALAGRSESVQRAEACLSEAQVRLNDHSCAHCAVVCGGWCSGCAGCWAACGAAVLGGIRHCWLSNCIKYPRKI